MVVACLMTLKHSCLVITEVKKKLFDRNNKNKKITLKTKFGK